MWGLLSVSARNLRISHYGFNPQAVEADQAKKALKFIPQVPFQQCSLGITCCFLAIQTNAILLGLHNLKLSWFVEILYRADLHFSFFASISIRRR